MDMQTVFIGIAAFVAITLILLITTFCMREKTYEEVLEEQRKQQEELFGKPVQAKDKKKKKAFKKGKEKEKVVVDKTEDKSSQVTDHFDQKMVEIEPDPEIIEPTAEPVHTTPRKRKAGKSILTNKTEKSLVSKTSVVTTTTSFHPGHPPMDDVELKHERERRASVSEQHLREMAPIAPPVEAMADKKDKKKKEREAKKQLEAAEVIVQEEIRITHAVEAQAAPAPPPPKPEGKKERKRRSPDSGDGVSDSSKMVEAIRMAPLSDVDIQLLIDVLLTKQTGTITKTDEWTQKPQKGDPTFALKKQLEEKERALQEEQTQAHAANTKVKEQKEQILQEKQKLVILQKQAEEKINRQGAEIKALQDRMAHTAEQHRMELHRQMEQARPGPDPQQAEMVRQLQEENQRLQAEMAHLRNSTLDMGNMQSQLKIMQDEMAKNARQLAQTDGAKKSFENKCRQQEETIRQLEAGKKDAENVLSRKLKETEEQLRRAESRNSGLARDLDKSKSVGHQAEKEAANLRDHIAHVDSSQSQSADQVRHLEAKLQEIEGARQQMEGRIGDMEKTNVEKDRDIQTLRQENHSLLGQLQTVKERTAGEGQEAPPRGDGDSKKVIVSEPENTATIDIAIHEKILGEKDSEVCKLQDELKAKLADLSRVNEDLDAQRKKNNELEEEHKTSLEAKLVESTEQSQKLGVELKAKTSDLEALTNELSALKEEKNSLSEKLSVADTAQSNSADLETRVKDGEARVAELGQALERAQKENSELQQSHVELAKGQEEQTQTAEELNRVRAELNSKLTELQSMQTTVESLQKNNSALTEQNSQLAASETSKSDESTEALACLQAEVAEKAGRVEALSQELETAKNTCEELQEVRQQLAESEKSSEAKSRVEEELKNKANELQRIQDELSVVKRENSDLRLGCEQATIALSKAERSAEEISQVQKELNVKASEVHHLQATLQTKDQQIRELREKSQSAVESHSENISCAIQKEKDQYSTALQKIFPSLNIKDTMVRDDWSGVLEKDVTTYIQSVSSTAPPDSSEMDKLQSQVQHYKSVLAQTEGILNQLQSSVESEEQKWHQKVNASEEELQGAREEVKRLKGSSEMKDQLSMLEERLSESESEREKLKTQLSQVSQEIDCLKNEVQESQQAQKKLQTTNVKLNGMLKTGYDSLKVEQENVRVLQKELANKSKSISNGTSPSKEIEELKGKLMTTQRQLDKEIQCNKALSQRLGASVGSEIGTSV